MYKYNQKNHEEFTDKSKSSTIIKVLCFDTLSSFEDNNHNFKILQLQNSSIVATIHLVRYMYKLSSIFLTKKKVNLLLLAMKENYISIAKRD